MKNREVTLVILDWSGTVSDDRRSVWAANMEMLRQSGKATMTFEEWLPKTRLTAAEFLWDHGIAGSKESLTAWYQQELALAKERGIMPIAYPDAHETLSLLSSSGVAVAVLSSHPEQHLREEAADFGLDGFLSTIVGSSHDKAEGLRKLLSALGALDKETALFVGDTVFDIQAAKEVGVLSGGACTGYHTRERLEAEGPDFLFNSLSEIRGVVGGIVV